MQAPQKRVVKVPAGRAVTFEEAAPNPANANSAVAISFQVAAACHACLLACSLMVERRNSNSDQKWPHPAAFLIILFHLKA